MRLRPARSLGLRRTRRIPPALFVGHLTDHERAALDLFTHRLQLVGPLFLRALPRRLHIVTSWQPSVDMDLLAWSNESTRAFCDLAKQ
jgi:hypothetical protein